MSPDQLERDRASFERIVAPMAGDRLIERIAHSPASGRRAVGRVLELGPRHGTARASGSDDYGNGWRRRESNPGPRMLLREPLRA